MPNIEINDDNLLSKIIDLKSVWESELELSISKMKLPNGVENTDKLSIEKLKDKFIHPLDDDVLKKLKELKADYDKDIEFYRNIDLIRELWVMLIEKSVISLRFFDEREPYQFMDNKVPIAYGIDDLKEYFEKYADFEGLLYGSNKSYRDHVIHVFRSWLLGVLILLNSKGSDSPLFLKQIRVEGETQLELDFFETISMWTISSLCHDLGYPLEKSQKIFNKTSKMLEYFISNPKMSVDLNFSGVQDYINDHIVKFLSSKMENREQLRPSGDSKVYTGRVQPKYYIKLSKSLESYHHGIIGSIILYKTLVYFLETDYNVNEDYYYTKEESKQYYLRREILRAIASHTCFDIYHLNTTTLSFLLIICDDLQEWGRKKWIDFYKGTKDKESIEIKLVKFDEAEVRIEEKIKTIDEDNVVAAIGIVFDQYDRYKKLFRDGQDTNHRKFNFIKKFELKKKGSNIHSIDNIEFKIPSNANANIEIRFTRNIDFDTDSFVSDLKKYYDIKTNSSEKKLITLLGKKKKNHS